MRSEHLEPRRARARARPRRQWRKTAERGHGRVREAEETDAEELEVKGAEELAHMDDVDANGRAQ